MMLEAIKSTIQSQYSKPDFDTFYIEYMMRMQDEDIDNEIAYLFQKNTIDVSNLSIEIEEEYKKLVTI